MKTSQDELFFQEIPEPEEQADRLEKTSAIKMIPESEDWEQQQDPYNKNHVVVAGIITDCFRYSHTVCGERFFKNTIQVPRLSQNSDYIQIIVSEYLLDGTTDYYGRLVLVEGRFCSFNWHDGNRNRLVLYISVQDMDFPDSLPKKDARNQIFLEGHICKTPVYRQTPAGRKITDLMIAVDRPYRKSDYIPCICWERNALYAEKFETGFHVRLLGRVQSREYWKDDGDMVLTKNRVYEVSVTRIKKVVG